MSIDQVHGCSHRSSAADITASMASFAVVRSNEALTPPQRRTILQSSHISESRILLFPQLPSTCCMFRKGSYARSIKPVVLTGGQAVTDDRRLVVSRLANALQEHPIAAMFIDAAYEAPIVVRLQSVGYEKVHEVNFGGHLPDPYAENARAAMWKSRKHWLPKGGIDPQDHRFRNGTRGAGVPFEQTEPAGHREQAVDDESWRRISRSSGRALSHLRHAGRTAEAEAGACRLARYDPVDRRELDGCLSRCGSLTAVGSRHAVRSHIRLRLDTKLHAAANVNSENTTARRFSPTPGI
jgi:hypothetical protein